MSGFCNKARAMAIRCFWPPDLERTREVIDEDQWMHTGDLATMSADGYVNIVGRIKDMVIRGGENVYPREIEEFLYRHPKIQDVQVVGVPDKKYGEGEADAIGYPILIKAAASKAACSRRCRVKSSR